MAQPRDPIPSSGSSEIWLLAAQTARGEFISCCGLYLRAPSLLFENQYLREERSRHLCERNGRRPRRRRRPPCSSPPQQLMFSTPTTVPGGATTADEGDDNGAAAASAITLAIVNEQPSAGATAPEETPALATAAAPIAPAAEPTAEEAWRLLLRPEPPRQPSPTRSGGRTSRIQQQQQPACRGGHTADINNPKEAEDEL